MYSTLGIIAPTYDDSAFNSLTRSRNLSMLPYGCRYRLIDLPLSNMTAHGIRSVAVYTGKKIRSYMDHLNMGAPWNLNRRFNGLFLFPPTVSEDELNKYGEIAEFQSTVKYFEQAKETYVLYMRPGILTKVDLTALQEKLLEADADAAVVYKKVEDEAMAYAGAQSLFFNEDGSPENLGYHFGSDKTVRLYMNMILLKKSVFLHLVRRALERGDISTLEDMLFHYKKKLRIIGYEYEGFFEKIDSVKSYYDANMRLLDPEYFQEVFYDGGRVYTKTKDEPSSFYTKTAEVVNSLSANGAFIDGSVTNSLLFRGVVVEEGAVVKNAIIMQECRIEKDAVVVNAILDKNVLVGEGEHLIGSAQSPYVIEKDLRIEEGR